MIVVARLHSDQGKDNVWKYILEHHEEMRGKVDGEIKLLYATQRANHNEVSLFMYVDNIDVVGDFIANQVSQIDEVDGVWVFHLINATFFPVPKGTERHLLRYTVTIRTYPKHLKEIYEAFCNTAPTPQCVITYVANSFHLFGESMMISMLAKDKSVMEEFVSKMVELLPGMLDTTIFHIEKTHRLVPREEWLKYAYIFPEDLRPRCGLP